MKASKLLNILWDYFLMTVGSVIFCMAWTTFLIPNGLASGGLTGFCTILQYGLGIPVGVTYPILNVVLLILGFFSLGKGFGFKTIYVILLTSALFDILPQFESLEVLMDEKLLVALVGAAMESIGIGLVLLRGGSTGGTDIIAMILNRYLHVPFSRGVLIADTCVVMAGLVVIGFGIGTQNGEAGGWLLSLYSLICIFVSTRVIDYVIDGASYDKLLFIIGNTHSEALREYIIKDLERGGTYIKSSGMYSNDDKEMIFLVVSRREVAQVQRKIREIDPTLFVVVTDAYDTFGEGFKPLPDKDTMLND
jgi:uncharacterized membrane-anchored protein YitT (DUF2179 family)